MATLQSAKAKTAAATRFLHAGMIVEHAAYTGSAALSAGDVIQMVKVPAGARLADYVVTCNALSPSVGPAVALGDGLDTNRYFGTGTITNTVPIRGLRHHAGHGYEYTAGDTIDIFVDSAGGDPTTAPVFKGTFWFYVDN